MWVQRTGPCWCIIVKHHRWQKSCFYLGYDGQSLWGSLTIQQGLWLIQAHGGVQRFMQGKWCCILFESGESVVLRAVCSARAGKNVEMYRTRPRKHWTFLADVGVGQLRMWQTLESSALMPLCEMVWPRKLSSVLKRLNFLEEQYSWALLRASRTRDTLYLCFASVWDQMMIDLPDEIFKCHSYTVLIGCRGILETHGHHNPFP